MSKTIIINRCLLYLFPPTVLLGLSVLLLGWFWPTQPASPIRRGICADLGELSNRYPSVGHDLAGLPFKGPFHWTETGSEKESPHLYIQSSISLDAIRNWRKEPGIPTVYLQGGEDNAQSKLGGRECHWFQVGAAHGGNYNVYVFPDQVVVIAVSGSPDQW